MNNNVVDKQSIGVQRTNVNSVPQTRNSEPEKVSEQQIPLISPDKYDEKFESAIGNEGETRNVL